MMHRLLLTAFVFVLASSPGRAIDVAFVDPKTNTEFEVAAADIEETQAGITIKKGVGYEISYVTLGMNPKPQRVRKMARLTYPIQVAPINVKEYRLGTNDITSVDFLTYRAPLAKVDTADLSTTLKPEDRMKQYAEALPIFEQLIPKLKADREKRYIEYRYALVLSRLASSDTKYREKATAALLKFAENHKGGWQIAPALTMLASLQEDQGDVTGVQQT